MKAHPRDEAIEGVMRTLRKVLGEQHVLTDPQDLQLLSSDFSEIPSELASLVVRPGSTEEVVEVVKAAASASLAILTRGGGMSYTLGYVPQRRDAMVVDMCRMNRILEVNTDDMYVIVEPGVTWKQLREALHNEKYHIPFYGTLSGYASTVGGGLGNMATGLGKGEIADDLLGLEVVLYDGRVIQTGGLVKADSSPTLRYFGPDLTGLFIGDAGGFGIKTKAAFRMTHRPGASSYASFGFEDRHHMVNAYCEIARLGICSELTAFERYHHEQFVKMEKPSMQELKELLGKIVHMSSSRLRGIRDILRIVRPGGMKFLLRYPVSLHAIVDGFDQQAADRKIVKIKKVARDNGGKVIPPTVAMGIRVDPFQPVYRLIVGREGECSVPSHCIVPMTRAHELVSAVESFMELHHPLMEEHGLEMHLVYFRTTEQFGVEPIIYWRDKLSPLRLSVLPPEKRAVFSKIPEDFAAREAAIELRRLLVDVFIDINGAYAQLGKYYPYRERLQNQENWKLLEQMKNVLDPHHLMNPGALGLE